MVPILEMKKLMSCSVKSCGQSLVATYQQSWSLHYKPLYFHLPAEQQTHQLTFSLLVCLV